MTVIPSERGEELTVNIILPDLAPLGPDPAIVGLMIAVAALQREENRGAHFRTDFPQRDSTARRSLLRLDAARDLAIPFASSSSD